MKKEKKYVDKDALLEAIYNDQPKDIMLYIAKFQEVKAEAAGPVVNCFLEECIYCKENKCTNTEITLDEEHDCIGGCDDGWVIPDEEDEE